jgi:hypothetical protein
MAHHSITVKSVIGSSGEGGKSQKTIRGSKRTSSSTYFREKRSGKTLQMIQNIRQLNIGGGLNMMSGGAVPALAVAREVAAIANQAVNIYSQFMEAKTGEGMKYHNMRQGISIITNPMGFAKTAVWDNYILGQMVVNRQNQSLEYDKQLTGSLINGKLYQSGTI